MNWGYQAALSATTAARILAVAQLFAPVGVTGAAALAATAGCAVARATLRRGWRAWPRENSTAARTMSGSTS